MPSNRKIIIYALDLIINLLDLIIWALKLLICALKLVSGSLATQTKPKIYSSRKC